MGLGNCRDSGECEGGSGTELEYTGLEATK